ncbi:hypothetical protein AMTRI_Chr03g147930 [Amborella trichopoda]
MENNWQDPVIQECEGAQHEAMPDEQEDIMRLAWEEVQASRRSSYSTRERQSRSRHRNLVIHDDDNIEADEGHNTKQGKGNTKQGGGEHEGWTSLGDFGQGDTTRNVSDW